MSATTSPDVLHTRSCSPRRCGRARKGPRRRHRPPDVAVLFTKYHPLLIALYYYVLLCLLLLGDFPVLLHTFVCPAIVVDGL